MPITLAEFIKNRPATETRPLHLVHCTTASSSIDILDKKQLYPRKCPTFGTDLLYMFYGRPAYKPASNLEPNRFEELAPVCLVVDPAAINAAIRILPFDSGGFHLYGHMIGPDYKIADFDLGTDKLAPLQLVSAFYDTNINYYFQRPRLAAKDVPLSSKTPRAYARLLADPSINKMDDRCGTIEVQFSTPIALPKALKAIVGPTTFFDDEEIQTALAQCPRALPLHYNMYGRNEPITYANTIFERVETFLKNQGVFG